MALHCAHCNGTSTYDQGDRYGCESCGGSTFYTGKKAGDPRPAAESDDDFDPAGIDGYTAPSERV